MKKSLVALTAVLTMGICCSSALASDIDASLKVGYNTTNFSRTITTNNDNSKLYTATGGGGLSITASVDADLVNNFGLKASVTGDYMNRTVDSSLSSKGEFSVKKWSLSGDALVKYDLLNNKSGLNAGVLGGITFASTNLYDALLTDITLDSSAKTYEENGKSSGGALVVGGFVDYKINDKMDVSADGYIGLIKFGDMANALNNYKINAEFSYSVTNNIDIKAGLTFANSAFSKDVVVGNDKVGSVTTTYTQKVNYNYRQLTPSIGVSYNF